LGEHPDSIEHLDYLFARSFYDRYPTVVKTKPELSKYKND
jgi:hypothetical protein